MATFNSTFFSVTRKPPNLNTGWHIRVLDYRDMKTLVAIIPEIVSFTFGPELSDLGAGSVTVDYDSPFWQTYLPNGKSTRTLGDHEYVFEAWEDGLRKFAWMGESVDDSYITEDETRVVKISGPGIAKVLKWAIVMRPGWPKKPPKVGLTPAGKPLLRSHSSSDKLPAYIWQFPMKWTTMRMWYTVFKAAQRRGAIPFVSLMFNGIVDSAKKPFKYVKTLDAIVDNHGYQPKELNQNLLDFLDDCTGQDDSKWFGQRLEWLMHPGFRLDVRRRIGVDRSKSVVFYEGAIESNNRTRSREKIYNRVVAVDVEGQETTSMDATSVKDWNVREQRNETNKNITDNTLRGELSRRYLAQSKDEKSEWTIKVPYDDPGRIPFRNFNVGDTIGLAHIQPGSISRVDKYRVLAIVVSMTADQLVPDVELTLQSKFDSIQKDLQRQITRIVNEPKNFSIEDLKNVSIPALPTSKAGLVYNPETGKWEADTSLFGAIGGGSGGPKIFVQSTDPALGNILNPGDFWLETYD